MDDSSVGIAIENSASTVPDSNNSKNSFGKWLGDFKTQAGNKFWDHIERTAYPPPTPTTGEIKISRDIFGEDEYRAEKERTLLNRKLHPEPVKYSGGQVIGKEPSLLGDLEVGDGYTKLLTDASIDYSHAGNAFNQLYPAIGVFLKSEMSNRPEVAGEIMTDIKHGDADLTYKAVLSLAQYLSRNRTTGKFESELFHNNGPFEGFLGSADQTTQVRRALAGFCSEALFVFNNPKGKYLDGMKDRKFIRDSSWENLLDNSKPQTIGQHPRQELKAA